MPRIAPIEWDALDPESRRIIEDGMAAGMYTMALPLQIVAHSPTALRGTDAVYRELFNGSAMGRRIQELMRLRSAQLGACEPCSLSRKDESISEEDVACLSDPESAGYSDRERLAIQMVDLMATDHHAIDDDFIREMAKHFTVEEIVEIGYFAGQTIGAHRFMHVLDALGEGEPVVGGPATGGRR
jgi:alkylhydroperoxidase family enzyme